MVAHVPKRACEVTKYIAAGWFVFLELRLGAGHGEDDGGRQGEERRREAVQQVQGASPAVDARSAPLLRPRHPQARRPGQYVCFLPCVHMPPASCLIIFSCIALVSFLSSSYGLAPDYIGRVSPLNLRACCGRRGYAEASPAADGCGRTHHISCQKPSAGPLSWSLDSVPHFSFTYLQ